MAEQNITALTLNILFIGLTLLGMLSAYILIVNNEGQGEIFDDFPEIESFNLNFTSQFANQVIDTTNTNANLSALYNPELAISAADQSGNAMALNLQTLTTLLLNSISVFMALIFGSIWTIFLSGLIASIMTYLFTYYFISWIRSGR